MSLLYHVVQTRMVLRQCGIGSGLGHGQGLFRAKLCLLADVDVRDSNNPISQAGNRASVASRTIPGHRISAHEHKTHK
jgi:hypothetical protein